MAGVAPDSPGLSLGSFRLDPVRRSLRRGEEILALPPKAIDLLAVLAAQPGEIVTKEEIFERVWAGTFVAESSLTKHISILRKAFEQDPRVQIETIPRRGYRLVVRESAPPARRGRGWLWATGVGALLIAGGGWLYQRSTAPKPVAPRALSDADRELLLAQHALNRMDPEGLRKARQRFQRTVDLDPQSAEAWAGLAETYILLVQMSDDDSHASLARAREAITRSLSLAPGNTAASIGLARLELLQNLDFPKAAGLYRRLLASEPPTPQTLNSHAYFLMRTGDLAAARRQLAAAQAADPVSPLFGLTAARIEYAARQFPKAIEELKAVLDREPDYALAHYYLALSQAFLGRFDEARRHLRQTSLHAALLAADEAWIDAQQGNPETARRLLAEGRSQVERGPADFRGLLIPALAAGEHEVALSALESMYESRSIALLNIRVEPRFDPIRNHPRFQALEKQIFR